MRRLAIKFSVGDLRKTSQDLIADALALLPDAPILAVAERASELAEEDFITSLDQVLRTQHFMRIARSLRRQKRTQESALGWLFPEIRDAVLKLPGDVPIGNGKTVPRKDLHYEHLRKYMRILNEQDRKRHEGRTAAVQQLMDLWPPRSRGRGGLTLSQVDEEKARKAGLIE